MEPSLNFIKINLSAIKAIDHDGVNLQVLLETNQGFQVAAFPAPKQALLGLLQLSQLFTVNQLAANSEVSTTAQLLNQIEMIPVVSSNIAAIGYSDTCSVLQVNFLNGTRYRYFDIPAQVFSNFLAAPSKGRYLNNVIKSEFASNYIRIK